MVVPTEVQTWYSGMASVLEALEQRVTDHVASFCKAKGYPYYGRIKTVASTAEKIESGRFKRWSDLDDLVAFAIIIPELSLEDEVIAYLADALAVVQAKKRSSVQKRSGEFRFDTTRLIATLKAPPGLEDQAVYTTKCEIQIRTAFEHAWQVATHDQAYKVGEISWERLRLASHVRAAVEQLDLLVANYAATSAFITPSPDWDTENLRRIVALYKRLINTNVVPADAEPQDWSRFSENLMNYVKASKPRDSRIDEFLTECMAEVERSASRAQRDGTFPRSLTLFQFSIGVLADSGRLPSVHKAALPITAELKTLYPALATTPSQFEF